MTGLGSESFGQAIDSTVFIHALFDRALRDSVLDKWQPPSFGSHAAFDTYNQYFLSCCQNGSAVPVAFPEMVDPKGILVGLAGDNLIHCNENQVHYYEIIEFDDKGSIMSVVFTIGH